MNSLFAWIESNAALLEKMAVSVVVYPDQGDEGSKSHYVDFDHERALGRITVWDSLRADLEFISTEDGAQLYWKSVDRVDVACFDEWLRAMSLFLNGENK